MWVVVITEEDGLPVFHIMPVGDILQHRPNRNCWCNPHYGDGDKHTLVHNSMDSREFYETEEYH